MVSVLTPYTMWPETQKITIRWLAAALPDARVVAKTGTDLAALVTGQSGGVYTLAGVVQVLRIPGGGSDANRVTQSTLIDVYCYTADLDRMWALARRAAAAMLQLDSRNGIDTVDEYSAPGEVPYGDPQLQRSVASYRLTARLQTTV